MIPLRAHNIIDYAWGLAALFAPYIFGFDSVHAGRDSFVFIGSVVIFYSLMSDYFYSPAKLLPINFHMAFDLVCAALVISAPLLFDYQGALTLSQYGVHLVFGAALISAVVFAAQTEGQIHEYGKMASDIKYRGRRPKPQLWRTLTLKH